MSTRIVPGIHSATEAVKVRPQSVVEIIVREGDVGSLKDFLALCEKQKLRVRRANEKELARICPSHQGVIVKVKGGPEFPDGNKLKLLDKALILALDHVIDPNNLGNIVRSSWQFGVTGVVITKDRSVGQVPSAQKVASGGFEHVPIEEVANLASFLGNVRDLGFWIYGLCASGEDTLPKISFAKKSVIVIGGEEGGLKKPTRSACDALVSIPHDPSGESLNASVAGAVAAYEYSRQITWNT